MLKLHFYEHQEGLIMHNFTPLITPNHTCPIQIKPSNYMSACVQAWVVHHKLWRISAVRFEHIGHLPLHQSLIYCQNGNRLSKETAYLNRWQGLASSFHYVVSCAIQMIRPTWNPISCSNIFVLAVRSTGLRKLIALMDLLFAIWLRDMRRYTLRPHWCLKRSALNRLCQSLCTQLMPIACNRNTGVVSEESVKRFNISTDEVLIVTTKPRTYDMT